MLKNNTNFTIKSTDKNLGPAILDTSSYVKQILKDHLLTKDYSQLLSEEVKHKMENLKTLLKNLLDTHKNSLSKPETLYFQRSLQLFHKLPVFYGLPKAHKSPMTLCPVVSTCGSLLSIFSTWLDFKMKELLPFIKSYLKNSSSVITDLKNLQLPQDALLFSVDAVSMYTNIDTVTDIHSINRLIVANQDQLPDVFPKELFLRVLQLVMDNSIFSFRETIHGKLLHCWMQNPNNQDFQVIVSKFITRLLDRGHKLNSLTPILMQAAAKIDQGTLNLTKDTDSKKLYIHWPFNPNGLQQKEIRQIYNTILQPYLDYDHMQIAISRPKNIKDILTRSALKLPPNLSLESLIQQHKIDTNQDV